MKSRVGENGIFTRGTHFIWDSILINDFGYRSIEITHSKEQKKDKEEKVEKGKIEQNFKRAVRLHQTYQHICSVGVISEGEKWENKHKNIWKIVAKTSPKLMRKINI